MQQDLRVLVALETLLRVPKQLVKCCHLALKNKTESTVKRGTAHNGELLSYRNEDDDDDTDNYDGGNESSDDNYDGGNGSGDDDDDDNYDGGIGNNSEDEDDDDVDSDNDISGRGCINYQTGNR